MALLGSPASGGSLPRPSLGRLPRPYLIRLSRPFLVSVRRVAGGAAVPAEPAQAPTALAGRKLFLRHCAQCHGEDGHGSRRGPDLDSARVRQATPAELFELLTSGRLRRGMPAWTRLPPEQRRQLVAYLEMLAQALPRRSQPGALPERRLGGPGASPYFRQGAFSRPSWRVIACVAQLAVPSRRKGAS
jgi:mono/diheme cytochrome c family protein